jgi:PLP dependent protein
MSLITENITSLKKELPPSVKLVAISKLKPVSDILEAYKAGQRIFGENRVQELLNKKDLLPSDIEWHIVGHLQSNKVKYIVPFVAMIHSVDSFRLLKVIASEASSIDRTIDCLLQVRIADEETKSGFSPEEVTEMLDSPEFRSLRSVRFCGVMGIGTFTDNEAKTASEFRYLAGLFSKLKSRYFAEDSRFREISMGMSGDYKLAIAEGSTMVRIGSLIFGRRQ